MGIKKVSKEEAEECLEEYNSFHGKKLQLGAQLGTGGTADVFRLKGTPRPSAVKMRVLQPCIHMNCELRDLYNSDLPCCHESKMMDRVGEHPNIVRKLGHEIVELWEEVKGNETADSDYVSLLFMPEYVSLHAWNQQQQQLTEEDLRLFAIDICKALERCAEKYVFHCDLKSANIFVDTTEKKPIFVLGDFGSATIVNPHNPKPYLFGYTPGYLAPEIADLRIGTAEKNIYGESVRKAVGDRPSHVAYDPRLINADVFSLGVMLYEILSVELPAARYKFGHQERKLLKITPEFENIIRKAVCYDPHARYASARDMRIDLEKLVARPHTVVFEFNQFYQAKEYLLSGKLTSAQKLAELGAAAGEARCELLLAYIHCIQTAREAEGCSQAAYRKKMESVMGELARIYKKHRLPMAQFLHGMICLSAGYKDQFARSMKLAAEKDCIPAMFMWGRILNEEQNGFAGRRAEGREYIYRAAEGNFQPALRYIKKYCRKHKTEYSDIIDKMLENFDETEAARIFEDSVFHL